MASIKTRLELMTNLMNSNISLCDDSNILVKNSQNTTETVTCTFSGFHCYVSFFLTLLNNSLSYRDLESTGNDP